MKGKLKLLVLPLLLISLVLGFGLNRVRAEETTETLSNAKVKVYFFRGEGCSHCAEAEAWFKSIQDTEGKYFEVVDYEVWYDESNKELMTKVAKFFNEEKEVTGVPYIIVGNKSFKGFSSEYQSQILEIVHSEYPKSVEDRYDVMVEMNAKKSPVVTYVVLGIVFALVVFIIVARHFSPDAEEVNYEDDNKYVDEADEEKEVEDKLEKALAGSPKPKKTVKASTKEESKKTETKKTTTKKTTKSTKSTSKSQSKKNNK